MLLPFWTSLLVRTYAWLVLLQKNGILNDFAISAGLWDTPLKLVHNLTGTLIGMAHIMLLRVIPTFIVIPMSFPDSQYLEFPPSNWSIRWYYVYLESPKWLQATVTSIQVGILTMLLATPLGTMAAYALFVSGHRAARSIFRLLITPMIVPVILIAIGTFCAYGRVGLNNTITGLLTDALGCKLRLVLWFPDFGSRFASFSSFNASTGTFTLKSNRRCRQFKRQLFDTQAFGLRHDATGVGEALMACPGGVLLVYLVWLVNAHRIWNRIVVKRQRTIRCCRGNQLFTDPGACNQRVNAGIVDTVDPVGRSANPGVSCRDIG